MSYHHDVVRVAELALRERFSALALHTDREDPAGAMAGVLDAGMVIGWANTYTPEHVDKNRHDPDIRGAVERVASYVRAGSDRYCADLDEEAARGDLLPEDDERPRARAEVALAERVLAALEAKTPA